jgi:outer membrane protein insertion porin family
VVILPFEVRAHEGLEALKGEIRDLVEKQLEQEGIVVIEAPAQRESFTQSTEDSGLKGFRTLGMAAGADFVVWGSFTQIGRRYSLDAKIVESYSETPREALYVEGEGMEGLLDSVRRLAQEIGMKILRREKVGQVVVTGNKRIEAEAIKRIMKTKKGDVYSTKHIQEDVKSIYKMGYFGDVRVEAADTGEGKVVTFHVSERETVRKIKIKGNKKFDDEEIKEIVKVKPGSISNVSMLQDDLRTIESLYKEKGYHHVKVTYEIKAVSENRADVEFIIEEGDKVYVKSISFEGNKVYDDDKLKDLMKTTEKGFFSWITSSGDLDREDLDQDIFKIAAYYHNHGYIQAKVAEPQVTYEENWIHIAIKIEEGPQFKVGRVDIEGDLIQPEEVLLRKVKIVKERVYNREVIREDILALGDMYSDAGYAYADISPRIDQDLKEFKADITYVISKGPLVYFEKIIITGNTKTRDKVIRRELKVYEQELFSGKRLKRGTRNLYRLDFFEDIKVNTPKGSADDKLILKIDVTEKPTGAFSFGGGYSSVDEFFAVASISQRNFLGRGQTLGFKAQLGRRTTTYTLSFTEPWLFDIPLSAGIDFYDTTKDYDTYDKDSFGGTARLSYSVFDYTRLYLSYNYDRANIKDLTSNAASTISDMEGINVGHTISTTLRRDSRDRIFNPTEGSDNSIRIKHAGTPMGGDIGFTRYVADSGWYFPLFWHTVGVLHGRIGYIQDDPVGKVPAWERFYLGGMNSVRGYDWRDISPREDPNDRHSDKIGGDKMVQFNVEFLFPLIEEAGLKGVLFFDAGNAYDDEEGMDLGELRQSVGYGIRWYSPIGPIRLEYGYILETDERGDGKKGEGRWEFTMGMAF